MYWTMPAKCTRMRPSRRTQLSAKRMRATPPPADNFAEVFVISSPEPLLDLKPVRTAASEGTA